MAEEVEARPGPRPTSWEIAAYALYLCGGHVRRVSTEDVTLKCFELAPDSFSWVKYPQYPDKDIARVSLTQARKDEHGRLVRGRAGVGRGQTSKTGRAPEEDGWELTEAGARWARENERRLSRALATRTKMSDRQEDRRKIARFHEHLLFKRYLRDGQRFTPALGDIADLFRCRVDSDPMTWEKRFDAVLRLAEVLADRKVGSFVKHCKAAVEASRSAEGSTRQ